MKTTDEEASRRRFLRTGGLAAAVTGLGVYAVRVVAPELPAVTLSSHAYGRRAMDGRILIAYASYAGSTAEVATAIGETLGNRGFSVDVKPIKGDSQVDGYQAVLIGSAVHHGNWLPAAVDFVKDNQVALGRVPVTLFCVHIQNLGNDERSRKNRLAYLDDVRQFVKPAEEVFFAGRFDRRGAALLMPKWVARLVPTIDLRKWDQIRAWAQRCNVEA